MYAAALLSGVLLKTPLNYSFVSAPANFSNVSGDHSMTEGTYMWFLYKM